MILHYRTRPPHSDLSAPTELVSVEPMILHYGGGRGITPKSYSPNVPTK